MPLMVCLTTTTTEKNSTYYYNITTTTIITTTTYKKERATKIRTFFEHISWSRLERRKKCANYKCLLYNDGQRNKKIEEFFYTFWLRLANLCFDQSISRHLENITTTFWLWLCWCVKSYYYNSLQKQQKGKIAEISKKPYQWSLPSPGWSLELPDW